MTPVGDVVLAPPIEPMLAKAAGSHVPEGDFLYEPKWDGFRCLIFRTKDDVVLQSRSLDDLAYAFPEVRSAALHLPPGSVIDGEIVVLRDGRVDFSTLSARIRPRSEVDGNIARLAEQSPAFFVAFDVLARPGLALLDAPAKVRRNHLEQLVATGSEFRLTPVTTNAAVATQWFDVALGAGLDGLIAKPASGTYQPGTRALLKIKPEYTADVVVAGWRPHKTPAPDGSQQVGSLVLGLYDSDGRLHHVGSASSFSVALRAELTEMMRDLQIADGSLSHPWQDPALTGRAPDAPSRWRRGPGTTVLVRPEMVAEVRYDGMLDGRFRHIARLLRWRPDRTAQSCGFDQIVSPSVQSVDDVLGLTS